MAAELNTVRGTSLAEFAQRLSGSVLVVTHGLDERQSESALPHLPNVTVQVIGQDFNPPKKRHGTVVLAVRDRLALRTAGTLLPRLGVARRVGCWIGEHDGQPPLVTPAPDWPRITHLVARCDDGSAWVMCHLAADVPARKLLRHIVRDCVPGPAIGARWPTVGWRSGAGVPVPAADMSAVVVAVDTMANRFSDDSDIPPDVWLDPEGDAAAPFSSSTHGVLGRAPAHVAFEPPPRWDEWKRRDAAQALSALRRDGTLGLAPIDERLVNPVGFEPLINPPAVMTADPSDLAVLVVHSNEGQLTRIDSRNGVGSKQVRALRGCRSVEVSWQGGVGPHSYARVVVSLAMAGVPIRSSSVPAWACALLGEELAALVAAPPERTDSLTWEEHSIRQRRIALTVHSGSGWRRALAARASIAASDRPRVSVLLSTRRPENVAHALRQVRRQLDVDIELVLITHGFTLDHPPPVTEGTPLDVTLLDAPATTPFGAVLNRAARSARGDLLLKMDDDDLYGPHFVADLVQARLYSGAELVGTPAEFQYISPLQVSIRRMGRTETYAGHVAGGTLMIDRSAFAAVGGFRPVHKFVDATLLKSLDALGAVVYRAHGLGYLLVRTESGHTWDPGLEYFTAEDRITSRWEGFFANGLLQATEFDLPGMAKSTMSDAAPTTSTTAAHRR